MVRDGENGRDKTIFASFDTITVITVFYIKEQIVINDNRISVITLVPTKIAKRNPFLKPWPLV
jgi:hypothetical protein